MLEIVQCISMRVVEPHEQSRGLIGSETYLLSFCVTFLKQYLRVAFALRSR
jgi:hypothetical protein